MKLRCLVIALALLAAFASDSRGQSQKPSRNDAQKTEQATKPDQRGTPNQPLSVNIVPTDEQKADAQKKDRDAAIKAADDKKLVEYTGYQVLIGIITFFIFVLQLIAFSLQACYMRRSYVEMRRTTRATIRATLAAQNALKLGRDEFIASHRPEMKIHSLRILPFESLIPPEKQLLRVEFIIINAGTGGATVTQSAVYLEYRPDPPYIPDLVKNGIIGQRHYPVGDVNRMWVSADSSSRELHTNRPEGWFLYLSGWLDYEDGTGNTRSTFFCRKFDRALERFTPVDDPECNCTY